jgi:hypothetical protein
MTPLRAEPPEGLVTLLPWLAETSWQLALDGVHVASVSSPTYDSRSPIGR